VAVRVGVDCVRTKSCTIVFVVRNFLFTSSDTFAVGCVSFEKKRTENNEWAKRRIRLFRHRHGLCEADEDG